MSKIGYARVSTTDQDLSQQIKRLKQAGCTIIRSEKASSASLEGRDELETILQFLNRNDELVVVSLDRLGRSTRDVLNIVHELEHKGAFLHILEPDMTTAGDMGSLMVTILGMVADMELRFIKDRQKAGIEAAKSRGVYKGRRKKIDDAEIQRLFSSGATKAQISRQLGISRMSIYRALDKFSSERSVQRELQPILIQLHVTFINSDREDKDLDKVYKQCKTLLEKRHQAVTADSRTYQLELRGDLTEEALDDEIDNLYSDIYDLAGKHHCSLQADIREVGGLKRAWE